MKPITITVYGTPAPQGSKRAFRNEHTGRIQQVESSKKVKPWRLAVQWAVQDALVDGQPDPEAWTESDTVPGIIEATPRQPFDGPLCAEIVFTFPRPKGHWRTGRNSHQLRDGAPVYPAGRPDLSKLVRSTEDALTDAGVWRDDAQVVELFTGKRYVGMAGALDRPGAVIRIWPAVNVPEAATPTPAAIAAPARVDEPASGTQQVMLP